MDTDHNETGSDTETPLRHNMVSPIDHHWNDGPSRTHSQVKPTGFERLDTAIRASAPLGEDDNGHALGNLLGCVQEALVSGPSIRTIDADVTNPGHGKPKNWNLKEFLLGQPPKLNREISKER
jgi:hypothetical protein